MERRTAKEILAIIEGLLLREDEESGKLWDILTALRGPDTSANKGHTILIRQIAFPRLAEKISSDLDCSATFSNAPMFHFTNSDPKPTTPPNGDHFGLHIRRAMESLEKLSRE